MTEQHVIRCWYDLRLPTDRLDRLVEKAARRESSFGDMDLRSQRRILGWSLHSQADADELRKRLARCPEVTVE